jgi:TRAP-type C4-dicarboxylate transport system permease small subunit
VRHDRVSASISWVSKWVAGGCLAAIVVLITVQVFCRYVLNAPLSWPEELASILFISMTYLGALVLPALRQHVSVDVFYLLLPRWAGRLLDVATDLFCVVFFGVIVYGGFVVMDTLAGQRMPALQIPRNTIFGIVTVLAAAQVYLHVVSVIRTVLGKTPAEDETGARATPRSSAM